MPDYKNSYWNLEKEKVLQLLNSNEEGLSEEEAEKRFRENGPNALTEEKKDNVFLNVLSKFLNPLVLILLFASLISVFVGEITEFLIIFFIILVSVGLDFYQQYHAREAVEKLKKRVHLTATVIRDGIKKELPVFHLVPGDIIFLSPGDIVPADARLLSSKELIINQAVLTGESFPQEKNFDFILNKDSSLGQRLNCIFAGTDVTSGEGTAIIFATGRSTEFGGIASQLREKRPETEFDRGIKNFGFLLMKVTLVLVILVFFINAYIKNDILNSFLFALALAVGLTPELLPVIITVNLSNGAVRMAKKGVIVKDLEAIQNLGSMDILCTDKTGTLTEDKIRLEKYEDANGKESDEVLKLGFVNSFYQTGLKSPLEKAIMEHQVDIKDFQKIDEIPFDFERRVLSVVVKKENKRLLICKGAPESLFLMCNSLSETVLKKVKKRFELLSKQGFRVLAVATKEIDKKGQYNKKDETGLSFAGLMAFLDPPKESVKDALDFMARENITVKILTGDNELVTEKICNDLGLKVKGVITGNEIDRLSPHDLSEKALKITIFARLSPAQKERIILALKDRGGVVGFMGDGVNDAPSLKAADVGVSVNNATDVAKDTADFILIHKSLHVLKDGIMEGRKTYGNIMKYILMSTSSNFGNMFSVAGVSLFLSFLPMLPVQILLNNLLYDSSQLFLSNDNVDEEFTKKPKKWNIEFIKHFMLIFGPLSSIFDFLTFYLLLVILKATPSLFQTGWFLESLLTQTIIIFSIRTKKFPFYKSKPAGILIFSVLLIAFIGMLIPFSPFAQFFYFVKPPLTIYLLLPIILACYFLIVESVKRWFYSKYDI